MVGFFIGVASGAVQFWLLSKFTGAVASGKFNNKAVLFAVTQFLLPFAVLLLCAFLLQESLLWTGVGMAASLVIGAVIKFVFVRR